MESGLASIIIVNWNGRHHLMDCLSSLRRQTYKRVEVILVDNASADGSVEFVRRNFPEVRVIVNKRNLGFAEGNNVGIKKAKGEYIVLLNNDTKADRMWLEELVNAAEEDDTIGMCACKMLFWKEPKIINAIGGILLRDGTAVGKGLLERDHGQYDKTEDIFSPSGGAGLYKRKMLDRIGLLDSDYFGYYEDVDLAWRGRLAGWRCVYAPTAVVYHKHSASFKEDSPTKLYYSHRNRIWTMVKNFSMGSWLLYLPWILNSELVSITGALLSSRWAVIKGKSDALAGVGAFLRKRREIQRTRCVDEQGIRNIIDKDHKEFYRNKKLDLKLKDIAMQG